MTKSVKNDQLAICVNSSREDALNCLRFKSEELLSVNYDVMEIANHVEIPRKQKIKVLGYRLAVSAI